MVAASETRSVPVEIDRAPRPFVLLGPHSPSMQETESQIHYLNGNLLDTESQMLWSKVGVATIIDGKNVVVPYSAERVETHSKDPFIVTESIHGEEVDRSANLKDFIDIFPVLKPGEEPQHIKHLPLRQPRRISTNDALRILTHVYDKPHLKVGEGGYPNAAGVLPENAHLKEMDKYRVPFGRDALFNAIMTDILHPKLTETVAIGWIIRQGLVTNINREEKRGKGFHEDRPPTDARGQEIMKVSNWQFTYFGSVDSTPLGIQTIGKVQKRYEEEGADFLSVVLDIPERNEIPAHTRDVDTAVRMAIDLITDTIKTSPSGLFENRRMLPDGIPIQTWIDSKDSLFHKDGTLPNFDNHIAHFEANVYAFDALMDTSEMYAKRDPVYARKLQQQAQTLRENIMEKFWTEDRGGYFVPGIEIIKHEGEEEEDELQQFEIKRSNMGHAFRSRLLHGEDKETKQKREATFRALMSPDMYCARGIRTLSSDEKRFRETGYHTGLVWTWDSVYIGLGFLEHGYNHAAKMIFETAVRDIEEVGMFTETMKGNNAPRPELNNKVTIIYDNLAQMDNAIEEPGQELQLFTVGAILRSEYELKTMHILAEPTPPERVAMPSLQEDYIPLAAD